MRIGRRAIAKWASESPQFGAALNTISSGRIAPVVGGVLILQAEKVIGGVGMSDDVPDNDEACTIAGIQKADFETDVGKVALGKQ